MARSNKPLVWGPFAAGGTLTAFLTPVLILLTLLAGLGHVPEALTYEALRAIAGHWLGKLVLVGVVCLRITLYDIGVRADIAVATAVYSTAGLASIAAAAILFRL